MSFQAVIGIINADTIVLRGGRLAMLNGRTIEGIRSLLPPITLRETPVDASFAVLDERVLKGFCPSYYRTRHPPSLCSSMP